MDDVRHVSAARARHELDERLIRLMCHEQSHTPPSGRVRKDAPLHRPAGAAVAWWSLSVQQQAYSDIERSVRARALAGLAHWPATVQRER